MKINWKRVGIAVSSLLTTLAALPYSLGEVATIIPPAWKEKVVIVGFIAAVSLRIWDSATQPPPQQPTQPPTP